MDTFCEAYVDVDLTLCVKIKSMWLHLAVAMCKFNHAPNKGEEV